VCLNTNENFTDNPGEFAEKFAAEIFFFLSVWWSLSAPCLCCPCMLKLLKLKKNLLALNLPENSRNIKLLMTNLPHVIMSAEFLKLQNFTNARIDSYK
jgi:hypothetical protein